MTTTKNAALDKSRFTQGKDERMDVSGGYGGGVKDKTRDTGSTLPTDKQTTTAKPIGKNKASNKTDRS